MGVDSDSDSDSDHDPVDSAGEAGYEDDAELSHSVSMLSSKKCKNIFLASISAAGAGAGPILLAARESLKR